MLPFAMHAHALQLLLLTFAGFVSRRQQERKHQGLENNLISPQTPDFDPNAPIKRRKRLGGLLNFYYRDVS